MRLIYQQMLAFFLVIMTAIIIIGVLFSKFTTNIMYEDTYAEMEEYANSLMNEALRFDPKTKEFIGFDTNGLQSAYRLLSDQGVSFTIYNAKREVIYPEEGLTTSIYKDDWKVLEKRNLIEKKVTEAGNVDVYRSYFGDGPDGKRQQIAVVTLASSVSSINKVLTRLRHNLIIAFFISTVIAIILSYFLSQRIIFRLHRMQRVANQISAGDYNIVLPTSRKDELGALAADLNTMAASLKASEVEIQAQEERRKQFMANASHEMRTPLTTISGILEGLEYDVFPEEEKQHSYRLMKNETDRLIRLVTENLDYEKLRQNKIVLQKQQFNSIPVLKNLVEQLNKRAVAQNDSITLVNKTDVDVFADQDRFTQIIFNLVNNAIQFTENGTITVTARRIADAAVYQVTDTGIGMTPEQVAKIWDRYYKADPSRTVKGEFGLGMAIVKQLVELHDGDIEVTSTANVGTTFIVTIPDKQSKD